MQILETVDEDLQSSSRLLRLPSVRDELKPQQSTYVPASLYGPQLSSHTFEVKAKLFELELEKEES